MVQTINCGVRVGAHSKGWIFAAQNPADAHRNSSHWTIIHATVDVCVAGNASAATQYVGDKHASNHGHICKSILFLPPSVPPSAPLSVYPFLTLSPSPPHLAILSLLLTGDCIRDTGPYRSAKGGALAKFLEPSTPVQGFKVNINPALYN